MWTVAVTVLGVVVRLAVVAATKHSFHLGADATDYQRLAQSILDGHGFGTSHFAASGGGPTALRPPGFPIWLAVVEGLTGGHVVVARVANAFAGSALVPCTILLARRLRLGDATAIVAGVIAALTPQLVLASTSLLSEAIFFPLCVGTILAGLVFRDTGALRALVAAGLMLGVAIVTRPVGAVLLVPLALLVVRAPLPRRALLGRAAIALAVALAPAVAWEVRTVSQLHRVVPLTTQGGFLLAGTYNATSAHFPGQPGVWIPGNFDPTVEGVIKAHPHADEAETNALLQTQARHYFSAHPSYLLTVVAHNALRMFDLTHPDFETRVNREEFGVGRTLARTEQIGTIVLLVLALAGIASGALSGWPAGVWLAPALLVVLTLPLQSFTRFRGPADAFLGILAAFALVRAAERWRATRPEPRRGGQTLDALTAMRFPAALVVVLLHTSFLLTWLPDPNGYGHVVWAGPTGVTFFFILSGFVLTWSARAGDTLRAFARRRVARIVPVHVLAWTATGAVYAWIGIHVAGGPALASLALVHTWVPDQSYFGAMDTPSWSLGCEAFFYLLFPLLLARLSTASPRAQLRVAGVALAVPLAAALLTPTLMSPLPANAEKWLVVNAPPVRLAEFVVGILLALALRRQALPRIPVLGAAAASIAAFALVDVIHSSRWLVVVPIVPFAALIAALAQAELAGGLAFLRRPWPVRLGQWSFALYLVHWPILVMAEHLHRSTFGSAAAAYAAMALVLVIAVAVSGAVFTIFERPMERLIRPQHDLPDVLAPAVAPAGL